MLAAQKLSVRQGPSPPLPAGGRASAGAVACSSRMAAPFSGPSEEHARNATGLGPSVETYVDPG